MSWLAVSSQSGGWSYNETVDYPLYTTANNSTGPFGPPISSGSDTLPGDDYLGETPAVSVYSEADGTSVGEPQLYPYQAYTLTVESDAMLFGPDPNASIDGNDWTSGTATASGNAKVTLTIEPSTGEAIGYPVQVLVTIDDTINGGASLSVSAGGLTSSGTYWAKIGDTVTINAISSAFESGTSSGQSLPYPYGQSAGAGSQVFVTSNTPVILPTSMSFDAVGDVDYGYAIGAVGLPNPTNVDLYWASGTTTDTEIGGPIVSTNTETGSGDYAFQEPASGLGQPPSGAKYILAVVDPDNTISPAASSKVAALALSSADITATALSFDSDGDLDYGYQITGADLPQATTVDLYWAPDSTFDPTVDTLVPGSETTTDTAQGTYPLQEPASSFGTAPAGANYILAVVDPDNVISPADPSKVASIALPTLSVTDASWNVSGGGIQVSYQVAGADLPFATPIALYWASGPNYDDRIVPDNISYSLTAQQPVGTYGPVSVDQGVFQGVGEPPANAEDLLVVPDPKDLLLTSDASADAFALPYDPQIDVSARYNGSQDPSTIGRFFAVPGLVTNETFTLTLSDSLAAIRPSPLVVIGDAKLPALPDTGLLGSWDGKTYITGDFDPGTLSGPTELQAQALGSPDILAEQDLTLEVVPVPLWMQDLGSFKTSFNGDVFDSGGTYTLSGNLTTLADGGFTVPESTPFIGGNSFSASANFPVTVTTTLDPSADPTVTGLVNLSVNVFDLITLTPQVSSVGGGGVKVNLGVPLDPETLNPEGTFALTISVAPTVGYTLPIFVSPVEEFGPYLYAQFGLYYTVTDTMSVQVGVTLNSDNQIQIVKNLTFISDDLDLAIKGDVKVGAFETLNPTLQSFAAMLARRLPSFVSSKVDPTNPLLGLYFDVAVTGDLDFQDNVYFVGTTAEPESSVSTMKAILNLYQSTSINVVVGTVILGSLKIQSWEILPNGPIVLINISDSGD